MVHTILIAVLVGALIGAGLGWKLGRGYERMRPGRTLRPWAKDPQQRATPPRRRRRPRS